MKKIFILTLFCFLNLTATVYPEFEIIIPTYNNEEWCIKNLESLARQDYPHWHATIIVDCATDRTAELLDDYIEEHNLCDKITLIVNKIRQGALANIYYAAAACPPHKIICLFDGDDWLAHNQVLRYYAYFYDHFDIWLTYGQFMSWPARMYGWCEAYPEDIIKNNRFRQYPPLPSHFRTFYAWLFQKIKLEDLLYEGQFYKMTWDQAIMYPLIEMAGERHLFVPRITYIYNESNPINDHKVDNTLQTRLAQIIRSKPPYARLDYTYPPNKTKKSIRTISN